MFRTVGVVGRTDKKEATQLASKIVQHLEAKGLEISLEQNLAKCIQKHRLAQSVEKMHTDFVITIGGDGTILRTCLRLPKPEPSILSINMGLRGFLAEVEPNEALKAIDKCLEGNYMLERYMKLASFIDKTRLPDALNEVFLTSRAPAKLLHIRIWKGDTTVAECRSDGAIAASQAGSTGYSLSAGGPVIDPDVKAFVFTPIAPLTTFHPIVFSADSIINIEILNPKRAVVVVDGHFQTETSPAKSRITITRSEHKSSFIRFQQDFYHRLEGRLLFSGGEKADP